MAPYAFQDHTGELQVRLEAPTSNELFSEAARALAEIMGGPLAAPQDDAWRSVRIDAPDREALLVDWLNELIYLSEQDKRIFSDVHFESISDHRLVARVRGRAIEDIQLHVKAATFHGLSIHEIPGGFAAEVVLDV